MLGGLEQTRTCRVTAAAAKEPDADKNHAVYLSLMVVNRKGGLGSFGLGGAPIIFRSAPNYHPADGSVTEDSPPYLMVMEEDCRG